MKIKHPIPVIIVTLINIALWIWIFACADANSIWSDAFLRRDVISIVFFASVGVFSLCTDFQADASANAKASAVVCFIIAIFYLFLLMMDGIDPCVLPTPIPDIMPDSDMIIV